MMKVVATSLEHQSGFSKPRKFIPLKRVCACASNSSAVFQTGECQTLRRTGLKSRPLVQGGPLAVVKLGYNPCN